MHFYHSTDDMTAHQFDTEVVWFELCTGRRWQRVTTASIRRKWLMHELSIETPGKCHLKHIITQTPGQSQRHLVNVTWNTASRSDTWWITETPGECHLKHSITQWHLVNHSDTWWITTSLLKCSVTMKLLSSLHCKPFTEPRVDKKAQLTLTNTSSHRHLVHHNITVEMQCHNEAAVFAPL